MLGNYQVATQLVASRVVLSSMDLVTFCGDTVRLKSASVSFIRHHCSHKMETDVYIRAEGRQAFLQTEQGISSLVSSKRMLRSTWALRVAKEFADCAAPARNSSLCQTEARRSVECGYPLLLQSE
jgi:hypothetical protein